MMILCKRVLVPFLNQTPSRKLVAIVAVVFLARLFYCRRVKLKEADSSLVRRENYIMNIRPYQFSARDFFRITRVFTLRVGRKGGAENEVLPESRQAFEVAAARTFGPVNLVLSCQTSFFRVRASVC